MKNYRMMKHFNICLSLGFLYFYQCCCLDCDCPDEEIVVYNPEDINQKILFQNGEICVLEEGKEKGGENGKLDEYD